MSNRRGGDRPFSHPWTMQILILGCGYLGGRVAAAYHADGHAVTAVTRSPARAEEFRRRGWTPIVGDVVDPGLRLPAADVVVYPVGYDRAAGRSRREVSVDGLANVLAVLPPPGRFVAVSSTGVYGQCDGAAVDETAATEPADAAGRAALEAEQLLRRAGSRERPMGTPAIRLRFAGLYGPGRLIGAARLWAGEPIPGDPDGWLNLIHVDDGVRAVRAAAERGEPGAVYNVSDGHPVRRRDFYAELARLLGTPAPRFEPGPGARAGNRRILNRRLVEELGVELVYPGYAEGLRQAVNAG
jgi:nucleoside-diphosphate-sugar epimerase